MEDRDYDDAANDRHEDDEEYEENYEEGGDKEIEEEKKLEEENAEENPDSEEKEESEILEEEDINPIVNDNKVKAMQERKTPRFMTKYERARIIGTRALQISKNSPVYVDLGRGQ